MTLPFTAEYGSKLFEDNMSKRTKIMIATYVNPHEIEYPVTFYHLTEGYVFAGSCARFTKEVWGYKIDYLDGTFGGRSFLTEKEAMDAWNNLNKKDIQNV